MRSGLKHLLAYQLTKPNQKCYAIIRSFVFQPIKIIIDKQLSAVCIRTEYAFTVYENRCIVLDYNHFKLDIFIEHDKRPIKIWGILTNKEQMHVESLYKEHKFAELLQYCKIFI